MLASLRLHLRPEAQCGGTIVAVVTSVVQCGVTNVPRPSAKQSVPVVGPPTLRQSRREDKTVLYDVEYIDRMMQHWSGLGQYGAG